MLRYIKKANTLFFSKIPENRFLSASFEQIYSYPLPVQIYYNIFASNNPEYPIFRYIKVSLITSCSLFLGLYLNFQHNWNAFGKTF